MFAGKNMVSSLDFWGEKGWTNRDLKYYKWFQNVKKVPTQFVGQQDDLNKDVSIITALCLNLD
jgi:hypothetical protein